MSGPIHTLTGKSLIAGVFGWPVTHSRSPRLHGYWLRQYGVDGAYLPFSTHPRDLERAVHALPALGFRGANVTLPHKERAFALMDETTPRAKRMGAVNTILVDGDSRLLGDNTDGYGFIEHLRTTIPGWRPSVGPAAVLGAGGAARAIVAALSDAGVPEIRIFNRTRRRAEEMAMALDGARGHATAADARAARLVVMDWDRRAFALEDVALLVNTTTLGMAGQPPLEMDIGGLPLSAIVCDIIYVPLETQLLAGARRRGMLVVDGLGMLLHQARPGFAAWFGVEPQVTPTLRAFVFADLLTSTAS